MAASTNLGDENIFFVMRTFLISLLLFCSLCACESIQGFQQYVQVASDFPQQQEELGEFVRVASYIDGDTFWAIRADSTRMKIRLIGIDAPETKTVFNKKKHPYGAVSKAYLTEVLSKSPSVSLKFDVDSLDRYGRTLAYVFLEDGTFLNELMLRKGHAMTMTIPPNVKHQELLLAAQREARENGRGLWKEN
ncbi:nuclease [Sphingobacterium sp. DK4209]|nr:nuclease [Sphingobacterium sp. DK4209]